MVYVIFRERLYDAGVYFSITLPRWEERFVSFGRWETTFENSGNEIGVTVHIVPDSEYRNAPVSDTKKV
jgi:hypothetical protein